MRVGVNRNKMKKCYCRKLLIHFCTARKFVCKYFVYLFILYLLFMYISDWAFKEIVPTVTFTNWILFTRILSFLLYLSLQVHVILLSCIYKCFALFSWFLPYLMCDLFFLKVFTIDPFLVLLDVSLLIILSFHTFLTGSRVN